MKKGLAHCGTVLATLTSVLNSGFRTAQAEAVRHILKDQAGVQCEVVVPREAGSVALFAGRELQRILARAFGGDVALLTDPSGERTALVLGHSAHLRQAGIDVNALPRDGFVVKPFDGGVLIAGRDDLKTPPEQTFGTSQDVVRNNQYERGTLYGVYGFLERFLGARFYFPGSMGTIVPEHSALALPSLDLLVKPDHTARHMGFTGALPDGKDGTAAYPFKNRHRLYLRTQTQYIPSCHGLREFDLIRRFGESNPEYFALMGDGKRYSNPNLRHAPQLCFSSKGLREQVYRDAEACLRGRSAESRDIKFRGRHYGWARSAFQPGYVDLMPQDGLYPCHCDRCQKHYKGLRYRDVDPEGASELIWDFIIGIAERLKKNNVPGCVTGMAYSAYRGVPERDIPDNVMVMVAVRGPWNTGGYDDELKLIGQWNGKIGKKVWLWNYIHKGSGLAMPGVPCMTPQAVGAYYKRVAPHIFGAYLSATTDHYLFQYLNMYVAHKVFWDNNADVAALLDEHYRLMFGRAAPVMAAIYDRFEKNWLQRIVGNKVETELGPAAVPPSQYELWENIYSAEEIGAIERSFAKAEKEADGEHRERVRYMRGVMLKPLKEARAEYAGDREDVARLQARVPELAGAATIEIDGILDEQAWAEGTQLHLRPFAASNAKKQYPPTLVHVLRDSERLYVAFDCREPKMDRIRSSQHERDSKSIFRESSVEVFLNPSGDRRNYCQIVVNASGSLTDLAAEKLGASQKYDWTWSSGASHAVKRRADGWTVELAIPFEPLGAVGRQGFPANFTRNRVLVDEPATRFTWSPFLKESFHEVGNFGALVFRGREAENLIDNPDFTAPVKRRFTGRWYHHPREGNTAQSWAIDTTEFISGGRALRLRGLAPGERVTFKQSLPGLKPNTEYELSYFIQTERIVPSHRAGGARAGIWDQKNHYYPANPYVGTIPWSKQRFTFKTGPNVNAKVTSFISLALFEATGTVWYDNVSLTEKRSGK